MNFYLLPSLQQSAAVSIAKHLWTSPDMRHNNKRLQRFQVKDDLRRTEAYGCVMKKLSRLVESGYLPEKFEPMVKLAIRPIGKEIAWLVKNFNNVWYDIIEDLHWTSYGSIDKGHLSVFLVENPSIKIDKFEVACKFCLVDKIPDLLSKLNQHAQQCSNRTPVTDLVSYWTLYFQGCDVPSVSTVFNIAIQTNNFEATKYFFQLLNTDEPISNLVNDTILAAERGHLDISCYLLNQMCRTDQMEVLRQLPFTALRGFLDWPWMEFFCGNPQENFGYFVPYKYQMHEMLVSVVEKMVEEFSTYQMVFSKVWERILVPNYWCLNAEYYLSVILKGLFLVGEFDNLRSDFCFGKDISALEGNFCDCFDLEAEIGKFECLVRRCSVCENRVNDFKKYFVDVKF